MDDLWIDKLKFGLDSFRQQIWTTGPFGTRDTFVVSFYGGIVSKFDVSGVCDVTPHMFSAFYAFTRDFSDLVVAACGSSTVVYNQNVAFSVIVIHGQSSQVSNQIECLTKLPKNLQKKI